MASSVVDIVNLALAHLGDRANVSTISPSDGSAQADHAARFYPQARDWLLERFAWKFAKTRATLALRSDVTYTAWSYVYSEPNNCLRILTVLPQGYVNDSQGVGFDTEVDTTGQGLILTNTAYATAVYVLRVTDPARFTPGFVEALSWFLAAMLAGPLIKGETGRQEAQRCLQMGAVAFASATGLSAANAKVSLGFVPSNIAARNGLAGPQQQYSDVIGDTGGYPLPGV